MQVKAKKHLGQHFLTDLGIAKRISDTLDGCTTNNILEIGPGMGVLTQFLIKRPSANLKVVELDEESVAYLNVNFTELAGKITFGDFLKIDLHDFFGSEPFALIGNYPYNISSQIFFKALEYKDQIPFISGMLQKEVAERLASKPGKKTYGILSVLLQAYYNVEYLFSVPAGVFNPPPKVTSAVISLKRNNVKKLDCNEALFKNIVKTSFNQRRKTLRNSLKSLIKEGMDTSDTIFNARPEQLSVEQFVALTHQFEPFYPEQK